MIEACSFSDTVRKSGHQPRELVFLRSQSDSLPAMEPKSKPWAAASGSRRTEAARRVGRGEDFLERSGRGRRRQQNQARFRRAVESDEGFCCDCVAEQYLRMSA